MVFEYMVFGNEGIFRHGREKGIVCEETKYIKLNWESLYIFKRIVN